MSTLLYDGDCRLCAMAVNTLHRLAPSLAQVGSWRSADLTGMGLSPAQPPRSLHWLAGDQHARGAAAVAGYLRSSTSKPWRRVGVVLGRPSTVAALEWVPDRLARVRRPNRPLPARPPIRRPAPSAGGDAVVDSADAQKPPRPPRVRRRGKGDLQSTVRLLYVARDQGDYRGEMPESPSQWLSAPEIWAAWVIRPGPSVLGHVAVSRMGDDPMTSMRWKEITGMDPASLGLVTRFFVHPEAQDHGYGDALLLVAESEIRRRGLAPSMEVVCEGGDPLQIFESHGWNLLGIYPWGEAADSLQKHYYLAPNP